VYTLQQAVNVLSELAKKMM